MERHYKDEVAILTDTLSRVKTRLLEIVISSETLTDDEEETLNIIDDDLDKVKKQLKTLIENGK